MASRMRPALQNPRNQIALVLATLVAFGLAWNMGASPWLVAAIPLSLWIALAHPAGWILIFMCLSTYRLADAYPVVQPLGLTLYAGAFTVFTLIWHAALSRSIQPVWRPEVILLPVLLLIAIFSCVLSIDRAVSIDYVQVTYWKIIIISLALCWLIRDPGEFKAALYCILLAGVLIGLVALYNKVHSIDLVEGTRVGVGRDYGSPIADPNDLALVLLAPFSLALAMLVHRVRTFMTAVAVLSALILLPAIVVTQSRGGLLGVMAVLVVIGMSLVRSRVVALGIASVVGVVLFVAMGIAFRESGGLGEISASGSIDDSSYHRTIAWRAAINMAIARPLNGIGIAAFPSAFFFYTPVWIQKNMAPHSSWFGMLAETGLPGLIAFVGMIFFALRSLAMAQVRLAVAKAEPFMQALALGLKASLIGFCVSGSFLGQHLNWSIYMLVALSAAMGIFATRYADARDAVSGNQSLGLGRGAGDPGHAPHPGRMRGNPSAVAGTG